MAEQDETGGSHTAEEPAEHVISTGHYESRGKVN